MESLEKPFEMFCEKNQCKMFISACVKRYNIAVRQVNKKRLKPDFLEEVTLTDLKCLNCEQGREIRKG